MEKAYVVAIVGGGPRSVYTLERLLANILHTTFSTPIQIHIYEVNGNAGAGITHSDTQPASSYLNRCTDQIGFAADESNHTVKYLLPETLRPTFQQWCELRYQQTQHPDFQLQASDVPLRSVHGLALRDLYHTYASLLNQYPNVSVITHNQEVINVRRADNTHFWVDTAIEKQSLRAQRILFITGHTPCHSFRNTDESRYWRTSVKYRKSRYIPYAYPLETNITLQNVPAGSKVGLLGMGLTAIDVCLWLTEGRGGKFERNGHGELHYKPSGKEPVRITAISPSGRIYCARAINQKTEAIHFHQGLFFTVENISLLRKYHGRKATLPNGSQPEQLDFYLDVFPLIVLEMAMLYYRTLLGQRWHDSTVPLVRPACEHFIRQNHHCGHPDIHALLNPLEQSVDEAIMQLTQLTTETDGEIAAAFYRTLTDQTIPAQQAVSALHHLRPHQIKWHHSRDPACHRFDWKGLFFAGYSASHGKKRRQQLLQILTTDIAFSKQGNMNNPLKAACDGVWRDLRTVFNAVADFGGLTSDSHKEFMQFWLSNYNRLSNGAGTESMEKIMALVRQGILHIRGGKNTKVRITANGRFQIGTTTGQDVDSLICGRLHSFHPCYQKSALYPNLLNQGLIRMWQNHSYNGATFIPGGIDMDHAFHPFNTQGKLEMQLSFIGTPAEGVRFFQNSAARPRANSEAINHADHWVRSLMAEIQQPADEIFAYENML
ncbi:FAD/NAD(P)-binding protein [Vibrio ruber]|uniref:FAD/NAD(P)-binding protein n=1 Tax=Vibrio ruber TaxID=184755 RepID=UPI0028932AD0|nr:FAD/NAD(P)-binding protein [Vibrio ruber]WNJ97291.1 FAD/NAD(P)-binding protein [Vibrio ruber]